MAAWASPRTGSRKARRSIDDPVFITSAKNEKSAWWPIYEVITKEHRAHFLPETAGNHGSRALWERFDDSPAYWEAVTAFLDEHFPREAAASPASAPKSDSQQ